MPRQQPLLQLVVLQTQVALAPLPEQTVPDGQGPPVEPHTHALAIVSHRLVDGVAQLTHADPAGPQALSLSGVQVEPLQHPDGHSVALQPEQTPSVVAPQVPPAPHETQVEPL